MGRGGVQEEGRIILEFSGNADLSPFFGSVSYAYGYMDIIQTTAHTFTTTTDPNVTMSMWSMLLSTNSRWRQQNQNWK